jgi:hypothetical protein
LALAAVRAVLRVAGAAALVFFAVLLTVSFIWHPDVLSSPRRRVGISVVNKGDALFPGAAAAATRAPQNRDSLYQTLFQSVDKYVLG